jgi:hypothetical protein
MRVWRTSRADVTLLAMEAEPVISREEAAALMFAVMDILAEARRIRRLLEGEDDGEEGEGVSE